MTQCRSSLISVVDTPYYHCISRCVRRAFLCGRDSYTGKNFDHRRTWMIERIRFLSDIFCIDICAYAIMSNHYHLVLMINEEESEACTDEMVCDKWYKLYAGSDIVSRWRKGDTLTQSERAVVSKVINEWRSRLQDISWFMRCLNEFIARKANKEDNCKGRFWEGRFKSQALLDDRAVLTCMVYVDLNPIRATMAKNVETSEYTSIFERIHDKSYQKETSLSSKSQHKPLVKFIGAEHEGQPQGLCYSLIDYLELADWTGRVIRPDKKGAISGGEPSLLSVLGLETEIWLELACSFGKDYYGAVGSLEELTVFSEHTGRRWMAGQSKLQRIF